jgi:uncharacterized protein (UPF0216 family)
MNQTAAKYNPQQKVSNFSQPDKSMILSLSPSEKNKYADSIIISYPKLQEMLSLVADCHNSTKTQVRPTCMRVSGESGTGKSILYKIYSKKYPVANDINGTNIPVLYSRIPCPAYIGGLPPQLLYALGDPFYNKTKTNILQTKRLYNLLRECKVEIIFLDEVQHLVDRNSHKLLRDSSDWFKELIDETGIPIIFLGISDSNKIFIENEQLNKRVRYVQTTMEFDNDDTFRKFLYLYDLALPLEESSSLADSDMCCRLFNSTKGNIKNIHDLLVEGVKIAIDNNATRITMPMFAKAHNKILYNQSTKNPFI